MNEKCGTAIMVPASTEGALQKKRPQLGLQTGAVISSDAERRKCVRHRQHTITRIECCLPGARLETNKPVLREASA